MDMQEILNGYENLLKGEKKEIFDAFQALLLEYNEKYNLTSKPKPI